MSKVFLFHQTLPQGQIFDSSEVEEMQEKGWVDTPTKLDLPKEEPKTGMTEEQAADARPEDLISLITSMGFKVLTDEQLEAELAKAKINQATSSIEDYTDQELIAEAERRGLKDDGEDSGLIETLIEQFNEEPESLVIDELVTLGNEKFKLGLRSNMKEATLIEKIKAAMNA